jgi:hypothetical protein
LNSSQKKNGLRWLGKVVASADHHNPAGPWITGFIEQFGHRSVYLPVVLVCQMNLNGTNS